MKKLKIMLVSALAMVAFAFFAFTPIVTAGATETAETSEITSVFDEETTESVSVEEDIETSVEDEITGNYTGSYYCQTSENEAVRLDFIDASNVKITLFLDDVEMGTLNATYQRVDNIVDVYLANEWFGAFKLKGDGTATDVSWWEDYYEEDKESDENTPVLDKYKTEDGFDFWAIFQDAKTWVIALVGSIGGMFLTAFFAGIVGHFKNKGVINTEKNVEKIAAKAAADAVKGIVGQSINLDISAEVNKAVEKFMYAIKNELDSTFDMAKNTEILAAEIALALSKSRVLTKEEQTQLKGDAKAVMAHAQKGGATIAAPATVVVSETKENAVKTAKESVKTDNGYTLNFGGV